VFTNWANNVNKCVKGTRNKRQCAGYPEDIGAVLLYTLVPVYQTAGSHIP